MTNPTFEARDLWATQVPYYEIDQITPSGPFTRTVTFAAFWKNYAALAPVVARLRASAGATVGGAGGLAVSAH